MNFSRALLGGIGLIKYDMPFKKTDFNEFLKSLAQPCILLTHTRTKNFFGGGISAVTKSPWQHAAVYLGKSLGERARKLYPELMGKRKLYFRNHVIDLNPVPEKSCIHEIIESDMFIEFNPIEDYNSDNDQLVAWMKPMTPQEIDAILFRALLYHGMPYDVQEIASFISKIKNPEDGKLVMENGQEYNIGMKVCSTFVDAVFDLPIEKPSPGDIDRYCKNTVGWSRAKFNC
jgi:hypothetical protein